VFTARYEMSHMPREGGGEQSLGVTSAIRYTPPPSFSFSLSFEKPPCSSGVIVSYRILPVNYYVVTLGPHVGTAPNVSPHWIQKFRKLGLVLHAGYRCSKWCSQKVAIVSYRFLYGIHVGTESVNIRTLGLSQPRRGIDPRPIRMRFVMDEMALGQDFLPVFQFSPVNIIPPLLHVYSSSMMFFSQCFIFPLSVYFHHLSILIRPLATAV
jgi:hypothetical protein